MSNYTIGNQTRNLPLVAQCVNQLDHRVPQFLSEEETGIKYGDILVIIRHDNLQV
jgi:hypothetical protein